MVRSPSTSAAALGCMRPWRRIESVRFMAGSRASCDGAFDPETGQDFEGRPFFEEELDQARYGFPARSKHVHVIPGHDVGNTRTRQQLGPWHVWMKIPEHPRSRQDQLCGARERGGNVSGERD